MRTSETAIEKIKKFEGLRLSAYRCPSGVLTIGYGHTGADVKPSMTISEEEADRMLREDLGHVEDSINGLGICAHQYEFDALVSFAFNVGITAFRSSTLLAYIRRGVEKDKVRQQFMRWVHSGGKVLSGLVRRREWEAGRFYAEV